MDRLDGPLAELVAAERDEVDAIPKSPDTAWAGIAAAWQVPPPIPPGGAAEAATTAAGSGGFLKVLAAIVIGTSAMAGGWALNNPSQDPPRARVQAPVVVPPSPEDTPPAPNVEAAPVLAAPPASTPAPDPQPARRTRASVPPAPPPGLAEELALVDTMRRDVAAGRFSNALALAKKHRVSFAKGSLSADRMDLEAAARCGRGDLEAGKKLAARRAKRWPRAPISDRLRTLCKLDRP